ncbi:hypothetical protein [Streptomyces sp. ODS05-4]|nr:hypothetical protein [Streptomyces sp. ODS05-4]
MLHTQENFSVVEDDIDEAFRGVEDDVQDAGTTLYGRNVNHAECMLS